MIPFLLGLICILVIVYWIINTQETFIAQSKPYIWLYWENKPNVYEPPNYIKLCHDSVKKHCRDNFNIVILNDKSVYNYLPELRSDIDQLLIPQKADYIRLKLLETYGGIWLDSDIIVLKDLMPIMNKMTNKIDFVGFGCHFKNCGFTGKPKPANWVMASKPNTKFIKMCVQNCDRLLDKKKKLNYFDLGRTLLWKCIKKMKTDDKKWDYYHYDSKCLERDSNFKKIRNNRLLSNEDLDQKCINDSLFIPIYNTAPGFPEWFKNLSKNEILERNMLISKLFRKSKT